MSEVYVQVLYDFKYYSEDGNEVKIKAGEELLLLKKSNENWWQVIRNSEESPFFAPSNYLTVIGLNCKETYESVDVNSNFTEDNQQTDNLKQSVKPKPPQILKKAFEENKLRHYNIHQKLAKDGLAFKNPLCSDEFFSSSYEKEQENHESLTNELNDGKSDRLYIQNDDKNLIQDSVSPIYVNIPLSVGKAPPVPKATDIPLRKLSNDWCEYLDEETTRKYYFHPSSGKITWKPPRRRENLQSTPLNSEPNSPRFGDSSNIVPEPPPKQLKPKLKKLAHSSNESLESTPSSCMFTILPAGWSQESDSLTGAVYYYNEATKKKGSRTGISPSINTRYTWCFRIHRQNFKGRMKSGDNSDKDSDLSYCSNAELCLGCTQWFSSLDENGRTYFYDEDSSESVWELPDLSASSDFEESKKSDANENLSESKEKSSTQDSSSKNTNDSAISPRLRRKAPKLPVPRQFKTRSLVVPECVNLGSGEENKGFLPASFGEGYWPSVQDGHFSITHKGTLNKTKLVEGGRRIRKNWTSSFVVLTDVFLLFYKDIRSAHLGSPGIKPELLIDLNGALVEWCPEKSSRKNVFQISTVLGQQLLLQDDNAQTTREWFDTIQAAIMKLPSSLEQASLSQDENAKKEIKLARSKSTKHYPSYKSNIDESDVTIPAEKKRKIRDKLRQFFVRRPTLESLREKGILIDELVFGCHLENLCLREDRKVPKFVSKCIEAIEKKELTADGLYRASGNLSQVQKIRIQVNQDDYTCLYEEDDVHVLTGALKMFFREMKEPLFPFNMFDKFLYAIALPDVNSKLETLKDLVKRMAEPNYETMKTLFEHLLRVTKYHKQNRMQIQNLAIVFGPTLLCSEQASSNIALDMMHQNRIVEFLLLEFNAIFDNNSSDK